MKFAVGERTLPDRGYRRGEGDLLEGTVGESTRPDLRHGRGDGDVLERATVESIAPDRRDKGIQDGCVKGEKRGKQGRERGGSVGGSLGVGEMEASQEQDWIRRGRCEGIVATGKGEEGATSGERERGACSTPKLLHR